MTKIAIIIPTYNAEKFFDLLYQRITSNILKITSDYDIYFIDDFSKDNTWAKIKEKSHDKKIHGLLMAKNYGQQAAIYTGLLEANADYYIIMDCDLQDIPEEFEKMYKKSIDNDIVLTLRKHRDDPIIRKFLSFCFFKFLNFYSFGKSNNKISSFSMISHKVRNFYITQKTNFLFYRNTLQHTSFKKTIIEVDHDKGLNKQSGFNLSRLWAAGIDGLIINHKNPISISFYIGIFSFFYSLFSFNFTYIMFSILFFINSYILFVLNKSAATTNQYFYINEKIN